MASLSAAEPAYGEQLKGHAGMLLFAALISGSFSLGGLAAPHIDASALTAVRFALSTGVLIAVLWVLMRFQRGEGPGAGVKLRGLGQAPWRFLLLGALYGGYFVCMFEGLRVSSPTPMSAVFTMAPLMTAGFAYLLAGQRASASLLAVLTLGALGAVWVIFDASISDILAFNLGRGEAIFLVGVVGHAIYAALLKKMRRDEPLLVFVLGVVVGAGLWVTAFGARAAVSTDWLALPAIVWITVVYLAVFTTAITASLLQYAAQRLPASKVMAYTYLPPVLVILIEGASGRGWPALEVLPGVVLIFLSLLILLGDDRLTAGRAAPERSGG